MVLAYVSSPCDPAQLGRSRAAPLQLADADKNSCWYNQQPGRISLDSQVRSSKYYCNRAAATAAILLILSNGLGLHFPVARPTIIHAALDVALRSPCPKPS